MHRDGLYYRRQIGGDEPLCHDYNILFLFLHGLWGDKEGLEIMSDV